MLVQKPFNKFNNTKNRRNKKHCQKHKQQSGKRETEDESDKLAVPQSRNVCVQLQHEVQVEQRQAQQVQYGQNPNELVAEVPDHNDADEQEDEVDQKEEGDLSRVGVDQKAVHEGFDVAPNQKQERLQKVGLHLPRFFVDDQILGAPNAVLGVDQRVEAERVEDYQEECREHGDEVELVQNAARLKPQGLEGAAEEDLGDAHLDHCHDQGPPPALEPDELVALLEDPVFAFGQKQQQVRDLQKHEEQKRNENVAPVEPGQLVQEVDLLGVVGGELQAPQHLLVSGRKPVRIAEKGQALEKRVKPQLLHQVELLHKHQDRAGVLRPKLAVVLVECQIVDEHIEDQQELGHRLDSGDRGNVTGAFVDENGENLNRYVSINC